MGRHNHFEAGSQSCVIYAALPTICANNLEVCVRSARHWIMGVIFLAVGHVTVLDRILTVVATVCVAMVVSLLVVERFTRLLVLSAAPTLVTSVLVLMRLAFPPVCATLHWPHRLPTGSRFPP